MAKVPNSVKIGIFFILALVLFGITIFKVQRFNPFESGCTYEAVFDSVYGIEVGSIVKVAGVNVGEVRNIKFRDGRVVVCMFVDKDAPIKSDSVASVKMDSLFGGYFIDITPGSLEKARIFAGEIKTEERVLPTEIIDEVGKISEKISSMVDSFDQNQRELMVEIKSLVKENREKVDVSIENIRKASDDIAVSAENIREIVDKIQRGEGTVGKLIQEEELYNQAQDIADNLEKLSKDTRELVERNEERIDNIIKNIDESAASVKDITGQVQSGKGTLGGLVYDEDLSKQTKEVLETFTQPAKTRVILGFDPYYDSRQSGSDFEAYLKIEPRPSKYYLLRASNIGASEDDEKTAEEDDLQVDLQLAYKFFDDRLVLRGGAIKSAGGFGVDYEALDGDLIVGTSIYDFSSDTTAVDLRLDCFFYRGFFLKGEYVDMFDAGEYRAGLGFEFEDKDLKYLIGLVGLR